MKLFHLTWVLSFAILLCPNRTQVPAAEDPGPGLDVPPGGARERNVEFQTASDLPGPLPPDRSLPENAVPLSSPDAWQHWDPGLDPRAIRIKERADTTNSGPVFTAPRWGHQDGTFIARPGFGDIVTTREFGDSTYHIDFLIPDEPADTEEPFRASSGIYVDGKWEIQIIDSHDRESPDDRFTCGAIFGVAAPLTNAYAPPGTWQQMEIAVQHTSPESALISVWLNGHPIHDRVPVSQPTAGGFGSDSDSGLSSRPGEPPGIRALAEVKPGETPPLDMGTDFTVAVRFRTEHSGPLFAKAPLEGAWEPNGKVLFIEDDGQLVFDIGWLGAVRANGVDVADGEWHVAVIRHQAGTVELHVDGRQVANSDNFTRPDDPDHVFRVGACSMDFPETSSRSFVGALARLAYYSRALSSEEITQLSREQIIENGLDYLFENDDAEGQYETQLAAPKAFEASEARRQTTDTNRADAPIATGPLRLQADTGEVRFANLWVRPLAEIPHASFIAHLDGTSLEAGRQIYDSVCITCHGNLEQEGTLPTSRRFWEAEFKNGNDPYRMYRTLSSGFGQMPQFPFLTPRQRYDVIHYVREALVKPNNPGEYFAVTSDYLSSLPKGIATEADLSDPPLNAAREPQYLRMNFGPALHWTLQVKEGNIACKGIAVRLDDGPGGISKGRAWMLYDHDTLRVAAAWTGGEFIDWKGIAFDGSHGTHTSIAGHKVFVNPPGPGWARPGTDDWSDPRFRGRDGKPYGPLPRDWAQYRGHYRYGNRIIFSYTVGDASVLESPGIENHAGTDVFTRTLNISHSSHDLLLRVAPEHTGVTLVGPANHGTRIESRAGFKLLSCPASATPLRLKLLIAEANDEAMQTIASVSPPAEDLTPFTRGGPEMRDETVMTEGSLGDGPDAYAVDTLTTPHNDRNPWNSWMRISGLDFTADGRAAYVCTWMGDIWRVDNIDGDLSELAWTRVASGLFQPLGLLVRGDSVFVTCRDQLAELRDLNGDGSIDWYRCFNNDHQVTEHFHEFAMGLQQDAAGNFYYAKSARHALPAIVEHHGTLLKVSPDGSRTEIVATGFRAANGVCLNPDGSFLVTDQEGHWTPKNRINRVTPGGFYGNMLGYHDRSSSADEAMDQPVVWITNEMDRSPGELVRVEADGQWGPLEGAVLSLSYGTGRIFVVPHETVNGHSQGGVVRLPIPDFPTGVMRGRFHPRNGQLYACGMFAWGGNQQQAGGLYRVRYTGHPLHVPMELHATTRGVKLTFTEALDAETAGDSANYQVKSWSLKRTRNYGSQHYDERILDVARAVLSEDGRTVFLTLPDIRPTWGMEIQYELKSDQGTPVSQRIHNTIHHLKPVNRTEWP